MMTNERSTNISNFITFGAGVIVLQRGHFSHTLYCDIAFFLLFSTPGHRSDKMRIGDLVLGLAS